VEPVPAPPDFECCTKCNTYWIDGLNKKKTMAAANTLSIGQQITFIISNTDILDDKTKHTILSLVMMNVEDTSVITEVGKNKSTDINLDKISEINPEIITHIYNIVLSRREALSRPAII
jgi:hypothetical protein